MVVPCLGADVMPWYREFKFSLGEAPRTWSLFKQQIRVRFRDSDFKYKLLTKMFDLQPSGTQQEYTTKFMQLMSMSSIDIPEVVERWFYQQNLRADASGYASQSIPEDLHKTIEYGPEIRGFSQGHPRQNGTVYFLRVVNSQEWSWRIWPKQLTRFLIYF
ncbi:hypothetical protein PI125_g12881 [Phytophthora idaei]|nr:hypothetical protein PI125_g12881 [Phytophthora idaei]